MAPFGSVYDGLVTWDAWLDKCNKLVALMTEGRMADDFAYDWRGAWRWGDPPARAVMAAIMREGVQDDDEAV